MIVLIIKMSQKHLSEAKHTAKHVITCVCSCSADTDWDKKTNGKRKEEEDPKWSTQGVKHWSPERWQTQVKEHNKCLSVHYKYFPWLIFAYQILSLSCLYWSREKAKELWDWMRQLEAEKFELQYKYMKQKYEVRYHTLLTYIILHTSHSSDLSFYMDRF